MKDISKKIQPLHDRVLIRESIDDKEKKTSFGLILPGTAGDDKGSRSGVVVAKGKGKKEDGKVVPIPVEIKDKVLFQWGDKIQIEGEDYWVVKESEIIAIIK